MSAHFFGFGFLLATTNLNAPAAWARVAPNCFDGSGAVLVTNSIACSQLANFSRVKVP